MKRNFLWLLGAITAAAGHQAGTQQESKPIKKELYCLFHVFHLMVGANCDNTKILILIIPAVVIKGNVSQFIVRIWEKPNNAPA